MRGTLTAGLALLTSLSLMPAWAGVRFEDVAAARGVDLVVRSGDAASKRYLPDTMPGGVCLLDYDLDGDLDVFLVNGTTREDFLAGRPGPRNALYRNDGGASAFVDVTAETGVAGGAEWGMGCVVGDYDNDGRPDLYVTALGPNRLYRNGSDGRFVDVAEAAGVAYPAWSAGATWADFDGDGRLDLYVANYVDVDLENPPEPGSAGYCTYLTIDVPCGPRGLVPARDAYYRNRGDGTFAERTLEAGFGAPAPAFGLGVCAADYDGDGDADLFVANDSMANFLFRNDGGRFVEIAVEAGVAYNEDGNAQASMGVDWADYDNDGRLDLVVTNFAGDTNTLYRNLDGLFVDETTGAGLRDSLPYMAWGVGLVDFDNDGRRDLYVANGHLYPGVDALGTAAGYRQSDSLYLGDGGRFRNVSEALPQAPAVGRGAAFGDLDDDGRVDVVVSNLDGSPNVLLNRGRAGNWLRVRAVGVAGNRDGIGARVEVTTEGGVQTAEIRSGCSYLSSSDPRAHFGLAGAETVLRVAVAWPSGARSELTDLPANQEIVVREPARAEEASR